jgi:anti-sigma regulatory factor (Ser/Thr protein kinase)
MRLEVSDPSHVGACRRAAQNLAGAWQLDEQGIGRVGIVATELAANLIRHARGGEILLQPIEFDGGPQIELLSIDRGPGMLRERSLRDGFSTAGGAGTGLGAVRRLSATFDMYSQPEAGTVVLARLGTGGESRSPGAPHPAPLEIGTISVAMRGELECGDTWSLAMDGAQCALLVVDGLGHGHFAALAAAAAAKAFAARPFATPEETMRALHGALSGTRGAAAACALLDPEGACIQYSGVGNIAAVISEEETRRGLLSHNGTLGSSLSRTRQLEYPWPAHALLVVHSDGLSARWSLAAYPQLAERHAAVIAAVLYREHSRPRDDATVVVMRRRP